ncbi:MAG: tryptophan synthase subunit alpha [Pseudomonadota bacterium]
MNKIEYTFARKPAFIAYLTAGQRSLAFTQDAAIALVQGGVSLLEIGVPFSDPIADGPVIQSAMQQGVEANITINTVLEVIQNIKKTIDVPIILFTYYNPLLNAANNNIYEKARVAGVDGVLVVDLPLEEADDHFNQCKQYNISPISVIASSTAVDRIQRIGQKSSGFLYYACRNGTTGIKRSLPDNYQDKVQQIKQCSHLPVAAGFGISDKKTAAAALSCADGFVVGSLFIKAIAARATTKELTQLAQQIDPRGT